MSLAEFHITVEQCHVHSTPVSVVSLSPPSAVFQFLLPDEQATANIVLALENRSSPSLDGTKILICLPLDCGAGVLLPDDRVHEVVSLPRLHVSSFFAVVHGLKSGDVVVAHRLREPSVILSSVVLVPLTDFGVEERDHQLLTQSLLQTTQAIHQRSIIEVALVPDSDTPTKQVYPFYVLECGPLVQGIVSSKHTDLILVYDTKQQRGSLPIKAIYDKLTKDQTNHFSLSSVMQQFPSSPTKAVLSSASPTKPILSTLKKSLFTRPLHTFDGLLSSCPLPSVSPVPAFRSPLIEVGVSLDTLKAIGATGGDWILLSNANQTKKSIARIYLTDPPRTVPLLKAHQYVPIRQSSDCVFLSPFLFEQLDLNQNPSKLSIQVITQFNPNNYKATKAVMKAIRASVDLSQTDVDHSLKLFFSCPVLFQADDRFGIPIKSKKYLFSSSVDQEGLQDEEDLWTVTTSLKYFKIVSLDGPCWSDETGKFKFCFVDSSQTKVILDGQINSKLIPYYEPFITGEQLADARAFGYHEIFNSIHSVISPCLHDLSSSLGLHASVLLYGPPGAGKATTVRLLAISLGIQLVQVNCFELLEQNENETAASLKKVFQKLDSCVPCILLFKNIDALQISAAEDEDPPIANTLKECIQTLRSDHSSSPVILFGSTSIQITSLAKTIRCSFIDEFKFEMPDLRQRQLMLSFFLNGVTLGVDVDMNKLALHTASFSVSDLSALCHFAGRRALVNAMKLHNPRGPLDQLQDEICAAGMIVSHADFEEGIRSLQKHQSAALGVAQIPTVKWDDVGGLGLAKKEILDTIQLPLEHPELFAEGIKQRSGVLLYGPPGTGKTLLAKAVATECSLNFISVKGPELINMYVGESEKNVRMVFERARNARPCVIFFDELDSLAPNRGRSGDSGGVMDRVVSQLLAELSDINQTKNIFVIGATNRPDLIDPALLVPGRLDKLLYLGIADDKESQQKILNALTRKFHLGPSTSLAKVATLCPNNLTGADFYALAADAFSHALHSKINDIEALGAEEVQLYRSGAKNAVIEVREEHFVSALEKLTPSVSQAEIERYRALQQKYQSKKG